MDAADRNIAQLRAALQSPRHKFLPSNVIVELHDDEIAECRRIANDRSGWLRLNIPNVNRRDKTRSQIETDYIGMLGEYAVAKLFGLGFESCGLRLKGTGRPDDVSTTAPQIDGGNDMTLPTGLTAQVKAVEVHTNPNRAMWFAMESDDPMEFTTDVGILAYVLRGTPLVKIPGYITRERFLAEHVPASLGTGKRAAMATCRFDPIEQLLEKCQ